METPEKGLAGEKWSSGTRRANGSPVEKVLDQVPTMFQVGITSAY
jgi:hypothetical protein